MDYKDLEIKIKQLIPSYKQQQQILTLVKRQIIKTHRKFLLCLNQLEQITTQSKEDMISTIRKYKRQFDIGIKRLSTEIINNSYQKEMSKQVSKLEDQDSNVKIKLADILENVHKQIKDMPLENSYFKTLVALSEEKLMRGDKNKQRRINKSKDIGEMIRQRKGVDIETVKKPRKVVRNTSVKSQRPKKVQRGSSAKHIK